MNGQAVVNVMSMVGRDVGRIDAEDLDGIDQLQHAFDLWPAGQTPGLT